MRVAPLSSALQVHADIPIMTFLIHMTALLWNEVESTVHEWK